MASTNGEEVPEFLKLVNEEVELDEDKLKDEYLSYFANKFSNLKPSEIEEIAFVKDDVKFFNTVQQLYETDSFLVETNKLKSFYKIIAEFDGVFFAFRKLLKILSQSTFVEEGYNEPHDRKKPTFTFMVTCFLMNAVDDSRDFAQKLCQEPGLLEIFVHFAIEVKDKHQAKTQTTETYRNWGAKVKTYQSCFDAVLKNTLGIFYNCSMYDENRQRLLEVGVLEACLPYLESHIDCNQQYALLCVAYLTDEEQSSEIFKAKKGLIQSLVTLLKSAILDPTHRSLGWHAVELAKGLDALSRNDTNKKLIIDCGASDVLLLGANLQDEPELQKETMVVLLTLSFDDKAKTLLKKNEEAMELFNRVVSTVPKPVCKKAAKGILWNLRDEEIRIRRQKKKPCPQPHIMISYQWDSKALVLKVRDELEASGYEVWIHVDDMEGSTIDAMAEAVENSAVVLICISRKYKENPNCRREAGYALRLKKDIIPLRVGAGYEPDGWLGFIQSNELYYDISTKAKFETNMKKLMKNLESKGILLGTETKEVAPLDKPDGMSLKDWNEIQVSEWIQKKDCIREPLGNGSYGDVYAYRKKTSNEKIAVKEIKLKPDKTENVERLMKEVEIMRKTGLKGHPNIVKYLFQFRDNEKCRLYIGMELMAGGTLGKKIGGGALPELKVKDFTRQILHGVGFLHEQGIIHRDIKGENILLDAEGLFLKLADFGVSKQLFEDVSSSHGAKTIGVGTCRYMAPEVVNPTAPNGYGKKCDIWSIGCVVLEMLTGEKVWKGLAGAQAMFQSGLGNRPDIPTGTGVSDRAREFLERTFIVNPDERPSVKDLLADSWLEV